MSAFTTPLILRHLPKGKWEIWEQFEFYVGMFPSDDKIIVPEKFITDLASVPRLLWWLLPPFGEYGKAAVLHDWLYIDRKRPREEIDRIFLEAMEVLKVPWLVRRIMFGYVRAFGWLVY